MTSVREFASHRPSPLRLSKNIIFHDHKTYINCGLFEDECKIKIIYVTFDSSCHKR